MRFRGVGMALAAALAWLTAFAMPGGPVQAAGKNASPRIPVVLVHGMSSSPSAAWGVPETDDPEGRGFYRALRHAGYEPGRTLFWLDYSDVADGDFTEIAQRRLRPLVAHVLRTSGAPAVDLVTHSMGGLVARHFLAVGGAGLVRTLVMIAPPNRGSFAADLFQEAAAVQALSALQPAIRFRLPSQPDLGALEAPFQGELPYVVRVARDVFHPLYLRFVENLFLASPAQRGRPVAFTSWLAGEHPDVYQHAWTAVRVQVPPVADARPMGGVDAGTYLTRAYFHDLAARAVAAVFAAGKAAGADGPPPGDRPASGSGRASVGSVSAVTPSPWGSNGTSNGASGPLGFLLAVVRRAWSQVVESVGEVAAIWGHGAVIAGARSLLGLQPGAPAVNRMVPERVIIPAPSTPAEVLANAGLDWLNRTDAAAAPQRAERYVTVVGVAADWWRWLRNDVGDNDLVVEVSSSLLPAGPLDRFAVFRATHSGLLTEPAVQRYVLDRLAADGEGRAVLRPVVVPADGVVEARLDGPIWVPLVPPAGGPVTVFLRAEGLDPHRFRLGGFAARPRGDGLLQLLRPLRHAGPDGTLELRLDPADGAEQWVGVRIDPVEGAPTPTELRDGRAWRVAYEILAAPPPPAVASSPSVVPPPEEGAWPATAAGAGTGQVPRVQVVYRNKH
ncbi:MAG: hypothetical protein IRY95_04480, partial [Clostridia bacterium]|nr:hypothetical protein [Clostridia bacterium]